MTKVHYWIKVFESLKPMFDDLKTACTSRRVVWKMIGVNTKQEEKIVREELNKAENRIEKKLEN